MTLPTPSLDTLETPALVVDLDRLDANLQRAAAYAGKHALALRPHVKTHKSLRIAAEQLSRGAVGLTCATPFEAEVMSAVCDDILVAFPPVGAARAARLAALPSATRLTVALDSATAVVDAARAADHVAREIRVYVELDVGMHRVGLASVTDAIALARLVSDTKWLVFDGIAFYPGHVRGPVQEQESQLALLRTALASAIAQFHDAGLPPRVVSGGSTPTIWRTHELRGVTEFRPGTYVYNDRITVATGACAWHDCALTVLATVVSTAVPGQAVIDAGTKSLGRESFRDAAGESFGQLLDRPEVAVMRMSEEHGILDISQSGWRPRVGERVRVVPNHVCIVVHLNDVVFGQRAGVLETSWSVAARGRGERF